MKPSDFDTELEELYRRSVERLICAEAFDRSAFEELLSYMRKKASAIKEEHVISKQVVSYLLQASGAILDKAKWLPEVKPSQVMAQEFELLLSQLAFGIDPTERKPGVPRIV